MKKALTILLTSALLVSFLSACSSSSSYSDDDSWKTKKYNDLTSSEKVKADKYIQSQAERIYK